MASTRTRQRKMERARYERKLVRRAQQQRRKRQIWAGVVVLLAAVLVGGFVTWQSGLFGRDPEAASLPEGACTWLPRDPAVHPDRLDVGNPPADPPTTGEQRVSIDLDAGESGAGTVEVLVDVSTDPCAAASLAHLAAQGFFDGTTCHELVEGAALRCGDPSGTGLGGPSYAFYGENVPIATGEEGVPVYPAGTVALADLSGTNDSQFLIFYEDFSPAEFAPYPVLGTVLTGLELVEEIGKAGVMEGTTTPAETVTIQTLTVADG